MLHLLNKKRQVALTPTTKQRGHQEMTSVLWLPEFVVHIEANSKG